MTEPVLRVAGLVKRFGGTTVLDGVDLTVDRHRVVALVGASGSGKSTLLRCVNLLEQVDDGQVFLAGEDVTDPRVDANRIRARIGVVFQQFNLFPHLSVLDNVTLASRVVRREPRPAAEQRALALLERMGLAQHARTHPDRLSGGQQQRVAIARAVAGEPELLLLDEITSALDPVLVGEVLDLVADLKQRGATVLMTTHEMAFAEQVADEVVFLSGGRILESGPPEQVLRNPQRPETQAFLARLHRW